MQASSVLPHSPEQQQQQKQHPSAGPAGHKQLATKNRGKQPTQKHATKTTTKLNQLPKHPYFHICKTSLRHTICRFAVWQVRPGPGQNIF